MKLLGVSGGTEVNMRSELATQWRGLVDAMSNRNTAAIIEPEAFGHRENEWDALASRTNGLSVIWLPIVVEGRTVAGLWLERWGERWFTEGDLAQLDSLALAYGMAWRGVTGSPSRLTRLLASRKGMTTGIILAFVAASLFFIKVPLRIIAPCEVVPKDPVAITAPLNGVIDEVVVLPGRSVDAGELLAVYDKRVAVEQLEVLREQVQIIESQLQRARVQAFEDASARVAIALLENRLEQEKIRLRLARYQVEQLDIVAPVAGTLMFDDPQAWRGRRVQVGERLMMIVDPAKTKLRIWLPEDDNIGFDVARPLTVILASDPRSNRPAALGFVSNHSETNRTGMSCFRAEAEWTEARRGVRLGLQGTVVLYGENVRLGYWLLRRPIGAVRRYFGI